MFVGAGALSVCAHADAPPPPPSGPSAGGLVAPPPPPEQAGVAARLDAAKREDAGRELSFAYVEVGGGYELIAPSLFRGAGSNVHGAGATAAAGARLVFFTVGARAVATFVDPGPALGIGPEFGLRFPLGDWEPRVDIAPLYLRTEGASGAALRIAGGIDYFVTPVFSVGANVALLGTADAFDASPRFGGGATGGAQIAIHL